MIENLENKDTITLYELFQKDIFISLFMIFLFLSTGIQWLIPVPPYPYVPFWGLSEYMALFMIYIISRKLINSDYKIKLPEVTKKIKINLKKFKEYNNFKKFSILKDNSDKIINKTFLLVLFLITSIFIIIPINDIPLSMLCTYICFNYFTDNKQLLYTSISGLIILLFIYIYIISKLIINRQSIGSYIFRFKKIIIISILIMIIIVLNKINSVLKENKKYKEYIHVPDNFKFTDLFK